MNICLIIRIGIGWTFHRSIIRYSSGPPCRFCPTPKSSSPNPDWRDNAVYRTEKQLKEDEKSHAAKVKRRLQIDNPQIVDYLRELESTDGGGHRKRRCRERKEGKAAARP